MCPHKRSTGEGEFETMSRILALFATMAFLLIIALWAPGASQSGTTQEIDTSDWPDLSDQTKTPEPAAQTAAEALAAEVEAEASLMAAQVEADALAVDGDPASHAEVDAFRMDGAAGSTAQAKRSTPVYQTCMDMNYGRMTRARHLSLGGRSG